MRPRAPSYLNAPSATDSSQDGPSAMVNIGSFGPRGELDAFRMAVLADEDRFV